MRKQTGRLKGIGNQIKKEKVMRRVVLVLMLVILTSVAKADSCGEYKLTSESASFGFASPAVFQRCMEMSAKKIAASGEEAILNAATQGKAKKFPVGTTFRGCPVEKMTLGINFIEAEISGERQKWFFILTGTKKISD